jgi:sec-independent protein translocase protein TatB
MFDIGWPELMLVMVVALVVIGPKDLPAAIRTVTTILRKMRGMAAEFQSGLDDIAREAGVDEVKRSIDDVVSYDPKAALDSIAEMDEGEFSLDDIDDDGDDGGPAPGNSILDPAIQSQMFDDDPDIAAADGAEPVDEDEPAPRPSAPASGSS